MLSSEERRNGMHSKVMFIYINTIPKNIRKKFFILKGLLKTTYRQFAQREMKMGKCIDIDIVMLPVLQVNWPHKWTQTSQGR